MNCWLLDAVSVGLINLFPLQAIREREEVYHEVTSKVTMLSACYVVHLKPPLYLRNALPIDISISVAGCTVANTDDVKEAKEVSQVDGSPPAKKNVSLELSPRDDFLDYGEKVVKPGDVLHLPTVKTTVKEGDIKSYLVARVRIFIFNRIFLYEFSIHFYNF